MVTKRAEIQRQLDHLIASYPTEHDEHEPYWRGVRHGLETALSILDDPEYLWFQNSRASGHDRELDRIESIIWMLLTTGKV